jgi:hypothetical protein
MDNWWEDDKFIKAVVDEAKRRGLKTNATCTFCGEIFLKQEVGYVLAHKTQCKGRDPEGEKNG